MELKFLCIFCIHINFLLTPIIEESEMYENLEEMVTKKWYLKLQYLISIFFSC